MNVSETWREGIGIRFASHVREANGLSIHLFVRSSFQGASLKACIYLVFDDSIHRTWGHSSAGRAPALQAGGQEFDPPWLHQVFSLIAQLVEHSTVNRVVTGSSPVRGAIWRSVRVVEGARLEIVYTLIAYRGFESLLLRSKTFRLERYPSGSRGPSAKGLDCVSGARVRIPLSPFFSIKARWSRG